MEESEVKKVCDQNKYVKELVDGCSCLSYKRPRPRMLSRRTMRRDSSNCYSLPASCFE
jgi:hypothetical protein